MKRRLIEEKERINAYNKELEEEEDDDKSSENEEQTKKKIKKDGHIKSKEESEDEDEGEGEDEDPNEVMSLDPTKNVKKRRISRFFDKMKGVIYLGHIPYGFFEDQMRSFFAQFGEVINLRLSRNKTTGKSKHFAFIQFASEEVAQIVAETMNGYFLYGKTLIVKMVPPEKVHPDTFIGANKKFRVIPWKQISRQAHNKERNAEQHKKSYK